MMATSATRAKGVSASTATIKNNKHTIQFSFRTPPRIKDQYITAMWAFSTNPRADGCGRRGRRHCKHACAEVAISAFTVTWHARQYPQLLCTM